MHTDPPYWAYFLILRVRLYVPVPHTPTHSVSSGQSPQSFQIQSTKYQFKQWSKSFNTLDDNNWFDSIVTYYISSSIPGHGFSKHDFSWYPDPIHSSPKGSSLLSCIFNLTLLRIPSAHVALHGDQSSCHSAHKQFTAMHWLVCSKRELGKLSYDIKGFDTM